MSAAEVPMPEPSMLSPETIDGYQHVYPMWNEVTVQQYGEQCRAAGYAAGLTAGLTAGGKDVERLNRLDQNLSLPIKSGWSAEVGVFGKIRLTTGPETQTSIRAAIDAALRGEVKP